MEDEFDFLRWKSFRFKIWEIFWWTFKFHTNKLICCRTHRRITFTNDNIFWFQEKRACTQQLESVFSRLFPHNPNSLFSDHLIFIVHIANLGKEFIVSSALVSYATKWGHTTTRTWGIWSCCIGSLNHHGPFRPPIFFDIAGYFVWFLTVLTFVWLLFRVYVLLVKCVWTPRAKAGKMLNFYATFVAFCHTHKLSLTLSRSFSLNKCFSSMTCYYF